MAKFKVALFLNNFPFQIEAHDLFEVMQRLDSCCDVLKMPMNSNERLATYEDLARIEHGEKDSSLSIADRPISVSFTANPIGFNLGPRPAVFGELEGVTNPCSPKTTDCGPWPTCKR